MATGTHFTTPGVQTLTGLMTQMATSVRVGASENVLNTPVSAGGDNVYIGLDNAQSPVNVGEVNGVGFSHVPSFEFAESTNVLKSEFQAISDLEVTATFGLQQLSPTVIAKLVATGELLTVNSVERIITGGVSCASNIVPLEFSAVNQACGVPGTPVDVETALTAMIITLYRGQSQSGWAVDDLARASFVNVETEWVGLRKSGLPDSRSYWSAYFF